MVQRMVRYDSGFRKPDDSYFEWISSIPSTQKQVSPFILVINRDVHAVVNVDRLLTYKPSSEVLHAWPGQRRTDIFYYRIEDFQKWLIDSIGLGEKT